MWKGRETTLPPESTMISSEKLAEEHSHLVIALCLGKSDSAVIVDQVVQNSLVSTMPPLPGKHAPSSPSQGLILGWLCSQGKSFRHSPVGTHSHLFDTRDHFCLRRNPALLWEGEPNQIAF